MFLKHLVACSRYYQRHDFGAARMNTRRQMLATASSAIVRTGRGLPAILVNTGPKGAKRFATFFTDNIRNPNTREAYYRATCRFFDWCELAGLEIQHIESFHVSAYIEELSRDRSKSTVKQALAAIRALFDWLVVGQIVEVNPAHAVRGPRHVVTEGSTPILDGDEMQQLLESINCSRISGLRDRALIGIMTATFGRISAVLAMDIKDYFQDGKHWTVRLDEKNGKQITMPVQHRLEEYLDAYIAAAGGRDAFPRERVDGRDTKRRPLFRTLNRGGMLTANRLIRQDSWAMIKRRAKAAGLGELISNHSFRGTGITNYLENGGDLREAQRMAGHSDVKTTSLYDRRSKAITRGEVERITILG